MKKLKQPYTKEAKTKFIIDANNNGWICKETEKALYALEPWEELKGDEVIDNKEAWEKEQAEKEREYLDSLTISKDELIYALSLKQTKLEDITTIMLPVFHRTDNVIKLIGEKFGYIEADLDFLFKYKVLPY